MKAVHLFQMRAGADWFAALDRWRAQQPGVPSRAEAIRRIVADAIGDVGDVAAIGDVADVGDGDPLASLSPEELRGFLN